MTHLLIEKPRTRQLLLGISETRAAALGKPKKQRTLRMAASAVRF